MIRPGSDARIHLYRDAVDMRKYINGLLAVKATRRCVRVQPSRDWVVWHTLAVNLMRP